MGQKFVTTDGNDIVQEVFDKDNKNVPAGASQITEAEFLLLHGVEDRVFSDFKMVGGSLEVLPEASDNVKIRKIEGLHKNPAMKAFVELIIDELNILRTQHGLPDRTMAQFKTAMKGIIL